MSTLRTYLKYASRANRNLQLPDVVGQIMSVQGSNLEVMSSTQKLVIILLLKGGKNVRLAVWDDKASEFRRLFNLAGRKNNVIVCTSVNPKLNSGTLYLNTTRASKFFFDNKSTAVKKYMKRLGIQDNSDYPSIEDEKTAVKNLETWSIQKLLEYIKSGTHQQEKQVVCRASVASISARNGWNYMACAKCSEKLLRSNSSYACNTCHETNAIGVAKFRVDLVVQNGNKRTIFVLFDRDATRLTNNTAENIKKMEDTKQRHSRRSRREDIPLCISKIVGRTLDFQVKINRFNFTASYQTFTVVRVC